MIYMNNIAITKFYEDMCHIIDNNMSPDRETFIDMITMFYKSAYKEGYKDGFKDGNYVA